MARNNGTTRENTWNNKWVLKVDIDEKMFWLILSLNAGSAAHQLGAIFEGSELGGDHRTRRRILSSSEDLQDKEVLMDRIIKLENETIRWVNY